MDSSFQGTYVNWMFNDITCIVPGMTIFQPLLTNNLLVLSTFKLSFQIFLIVEKNFS